MKCAAKYKDDTEALVVCDLDDFLKEYKLTSPDDIDLDIPWPSEDEMDLSGNETDDEIEEKKIEWVGDAENEYRSEMWNQLESCIGYLFDHIKGFGSVDFAMGEALFKVDDVGKALDSIAEVLFGWGYGGWYEYFDSAMGYDEIEDMLHGEKGRGKQVLLSKGDIMALRLCDEDIEEVETDDLSQRIKAGEDLQKALREGKRLRDCRLRALEKGISYVKHYPEVYGQGDIRRCLERY